MKAKRQRKSTAARALAALAAALLAAGCGSDEDSSEPATDRFDAQRAFADLEAQVKIGPRPAGSPASERTVEFIARSLRDAGAEGVRVQRPHRNVVAEIPGSEPGAVVVGAHHDTKEDIPGFVGANDGASGVAVVLELARHLAAEAPLDGPSIHLVLFDAEEARGDRAFEEDGTRGSRQYVRYAQRGGRQGSAPLAEIQAMVLFDMVGDCDLQIPLEANSDPGLYAAFADAAREVRGSPAPFEGEAGAVLDDHIPFLEAGVPAVDLIDFAYGPGGTPGAWWHTPDDTLERVCAESLEAVGEAAAVAIPRLP
ncbi:MAG TPA: M28 family metallopeptidase [Solirubrobacterales bacterium]|jgi:Zn-dependent M28 family amino/carboxypeptidase